MNTVSHIRVAEFFDGKVTIDELREFSDDRGFLCELWRTDDDAMNTSSPEMCYYSHTKPLTMRGPHEHKDQTDWFITLKSHMLYMFVYDQTPAHFETDPTKIYRVKVDPGIIHSYRNLSVTHEAKTANFPSSLFMGKDKQEDIDEIRHEPMVEKNKTIFVLGANGRLGKAITDELLANMKRHEYHVVPITDIINDSNLIPLFDAIIDAKSSVDDIVINCIALTNVQNNEDDFDYPNYILPRHITEFCIQKQLYLIQFSTDYIYQTGEISPYTSSKKAYEAWFDDILAGFNFAPGNKDIVKHYIKIIRLANLFSLDESDVHNMINKFYKRCENIEETIVVPKTLQLMPTAVEDIAKFLSKKYVHKITEYGQYLNLSGKAYTVEEILVEFFKFKDLNIEDLPEEEMRVVNNPNLFLQSSHYTELNSDKSIREKIRQLKK